MEVMKFKISELGIQMRLIISSTQEGSLLVIFGGLFVGEKNKNWKMYYLAFCSIMKKFRLFILSSEKNSVAYC